jgi:MFS family permease
MSPRGLKSWYFVIEGANAFATSFFFNYLFFHFRDRFQFTERENLLVAALQGLVYMVCAWPAGRFAQRRGYFAALQVGFGGMALVVVVGSFFVSAPLVLVALLTVWSWAMSFTWPALEALASEGERPEALPRVIGFYNLVWAGSQPSCTGHNWSGSGVWLDRQVFHHRRHPRRLGRFCLTRNWPPTGSRFVRRHFSGWLGGPTRSLMWP